jgi:hypothetical protein
MAPLWQPLVAQLAVKIGCTSDANDTLALPQVQSPATQVWPAAQVLPHAPQFATSACVSTHEAPQTVPPPGQTHAEASHDVPWPQTTPQPPQLVGSVSVLMHAPPHAEVPAGHWHAPPAHVAPAGQALSQPPQSVVLVSVSTHDAPHLVSAPQFAAQSPR